MFSKIYAFQRTSVKENVSQRPPFDHIRDPIYRRLMRDFLQGAQMPEAKVAALRRSDVGKVQDLAEKDILYSLIDGLQRLWCFSTCVLLVLHREKLISERCISADDWTYFKPFVDALGSANEATEAILGRIVRYEIFYEIDLEGLLHFLVTFNTGQRRMSLQVQLEIMHKPLIDEIEKTAGIQVFRDTRDLEGHAGAQNPRDCSRPRSLRSLPRRSSPTTPRQPRRRSPKTCWKGSLSTQHWPSTLEISQTWSPHFAVWRTKYILKCCRRMPMIRAKCTTFQGEAHSSSGSQQLAAI
jgi:hypothetical protein